MRRIEDRALFRSITANGQASSSAPAAAQTAAPTNTELAARSCSMVESPKLRLMKISPPEINPMSHPNSNSPTAAMDTSS
jgi:hypothetical protein